MDGEKSGCLSISFWGWLEGARGRINSLTCAISKLKFITRIAASIACTEESQNLICSIRRRKSVKEVLLILQIYFLWVFSKSRYLIINKVNSTYCSTRQTWLPHRHKKKWSLDPRRFHSHSALTRLDLESGRLSCIKPSRDGKFVRGRYPVPIRFIRRS